mmetsp:Transcript_100503/g.282450  ORF Transcript_100503/g.282450 Transcript_100503/m.282450 type:complete len:369 (+) Transcript_100503:3629-4735(+)
MVSADTPSLSCSTTPPRSRSCSTRTSRPRSRRFTASAMSSRSSPMEAFRISASSPISERRRVQLFSKTVFSRWRDRDSSVSVSETFESSRTSSLYCSMRHFSASSMVSRSCVQRLSRSAIACTRWLRSSAARHWKASSALPTTSSTLRLSSAKFASVSSLLAWICFMTSASPSARFLISCSTLSESSPNTRSMVRSRISQDCNSWSIRTACSFTPSSRPASPDCRSSRSRASDSLSKPTSSNLDKHSRARSRALITSLAVSASLVLTTCSRSSRSLRSFSNTTSPRERRLSNLAKAFSRVSSSCFSNVSSFASLEGRFSSCLEMTCWCASSRWRRSSCSACSTRLARSSRSEISRCRALRVDLRSSEA